MKTKKIKLLLLTTLLLSSCSFIETNNSGILDISVKFPGNTTSFSTKAISNKAETITLNISGEGYKQELITKISKKESNKDGLYTKKIYGLPFGNKKIIAQALDKNNKVVSIDTKDIVINEGKNQAIFEFKNILQIITFNFKNYSKNSFKTLIEIEDEGSTKTFKEINDNKLLMEDLQNGAFKFKTTVIDSFGYPISHSENVFNINDNQSEYFIDLKDVSFPKLTKLELNQQNIEEGKNFLADLEESFIPKDITDVFDNNIIRFPDNSKPIFESLTVNNQLRDKQNLQSSVILKKGDKINIAIKANDPENDKFCYVWGLVSKASDNSADMEILDNKTNQINLDYLSNKAGLYYVIIMIHDNKSDFSYLTIPVVIFDNAVNLGIIGN
jgi:hypothetical protein